MKFLTSNAPKEFSGCQIHMFKVSTMSAYIRAFQRTNSRDHTTHRDKMVQEKLYQVRFLGVHNIKTLFLKLKACQLLFKNLRNYIDMPCMGPEPSESISDTSETTQLLSHDCRTISKNFRAKKFFVLKSRFYLSEKSSILIHFSSI